MLRQPLQQKCKRTEPVWSVLLLVMMQLATSAAAIKDVVLPLQPGVYNPSLVVYQGSGWLVARSTELKWDTSGLKWIMNRAYLCQVSISNWSLVSCHDFDPWRGSYGNQCRWGSPEWRVPWEAWGVDDTKLFRWPGRGLWAITGRRPQQPSSSIYCPQPVVWRQWLLQLAPEGQPVNPQLFDHPPTDPVNITWGEKPAEKESKSGPKGRRKKRHLLDDPLSAATSSSSSGNPTGSSSSKHTEADDHPSHRHRLRRRYRYTAAGSVRPGYSAVVGDDSLIPEVTAARSRGGSSMRRRRGPQLRAMVPHHHRQHWRPAVQSSATQTQVNAGVHLSSSAQHSVDINNTPGTHVPPDTNDPATWDSYWGHTPVSLGINDTKSVYGHNHSIYEKNWMPFVWSDQVHVTYRLAPKHRVYLLHPSGTAELAHETDPGGVFAGLGSAAIQRLHGGPPLVYVDYPRYLSSVNNPDIRAATITQGPYYLGVGHYWLPAGNGDGRTYHHFLYKMEGQPPFNILQMSAELPLRYNEHYKRVAFVSGVDLVTLPVGAAADATTNSSSSSSESGHAARNLHSLRTPAHTPSQQQQQQQRREELPHVLLSYGSGDWESHLAVMTVEEVEMLFMQRS